MSNKEMLLLVLLNVGLVLVGLCFMFESIPVLLPFMVAFAAVYVYVDQQLLELYKIREEKGYCQIYSGKSLFYFTVFTQCYFMQVIPLVYNCVGYINTIEVCMSKDMQKRLDEAKRKKLPMPPKPNKPRRWSGVHGACHSCGCAVHECECK